MKNFSFLLLVFFSSSSLYAQTSLNTDAVGNWVTSANIGCNPAPLTPGMITGLAFPNTPFIACGTTSATGNSKLGIGLCSRPDLETFVFRNTHNFATPPCLVTYNLTADNDFRIYVNGRNSPTNVLPGDPPPPLPANGVCGNQYSGNNWQAAFPGTLNIADFAVGNNNIYFETQNGTSPNNHPFWLSGSLLFWQFSDLNSSLIHNFSYDPVNGVVHVNYQLNSANGVLFTMLVEYANTYPTNPVWNPFYSKTGSKKSLKIDPCPPVPIDCDEDGAAIRITFTAMAGACQVTSTYIWSCLHGFGGVNEQLVQSNSSSDNPNFVLDSEQIIDLHNQFKEELTTDSNLNFSTDSLFVASAGLSELQVFPSPSNGHIWVKTTTSEEDLTPVKIFNQLGELVFEGRIQGRQELDLSGLPNGIYYLKTFGEKSSDLNSTQFILQR